MPGRFADVVANGPFAPYLWRPWYDAVTLPLVTSLVFPLSRAWAAADEACTAADPPAAFRRAVAGDTGDDDSGDGDRARERDRWMPGAATLARFAATRQRYLDAEAELDAALFAAPGAGVPDAERTRLARDRDRAALAYMNRRLLFLPAHLAAPFPAVRYSVEPPAETFREQAARLAAPESAFDIAPDAPPLQVSAPVETDEAIRVYLREPPRVEPPPALSDKEPGPLRATALVPADGRAPVAAVVLAHGIAMEEEFWGGYSRLTAWFLARGIAVVLPEGPWHGRRRPQGRYGGETLIARGPVGPAAYFAVHLPELGRLVAWARARWSVGVGLMGISLGALAGQRALSAAARWPADARPDAALLVSPAASVEAAVFEGTLIAGMEAPAALAAAGWTRAEVARLRPLYRPPTTPPSKPPPARILAALGTSDEVVPYETGRELVDAWGLPPENVFERDQGHFALSLGLPAAPEPLDRFAELLAT